jgi:hypothetical protein
LRADYFSFGLSIDCDNAKRICGFSGIEQENIIDNLLGRHLKLVYMGIGKHSYPHNKPLCCDIERTPCSFKKLSSPMKDHKMLLTDDFGR